MSLKHRGVEKKSCSRRTGRGNGSGKPPCLAFPCARLLADTDLLGTGSPGATCADVGDFDVAPCQTRLPLQLAHGRVGCSAAGAHGPHYRLALGTTLAVGDPLPIDRALLVEAALRRFAGIVSCEIERSYDFRRDYSYFHKTSQKCIFFDVRRK